MPITVIAVFQSTCLCLVKCPNMDTQGHFRSNEHVLFEVGEHSSRVETKFNLRSKIIAFSGFEGRLRLRI